MLYDAYEVQRSLLAGASKLAGLGAGWLSNPANPFGYSAMPAATMTGPTIRGIRGPIRVARLPIVGESDVIRIGRGSIARPACTGE